MKKESFKDITWKFKHLGEIIVLGKNSKIYHYVILTLQVIQRNKKTSKTSHTLGLEELILSKDYQKQSVDIMCDSYQKTQDIFNKVSHLLGVAGVGMT